MLDPNVFAIFTAHDNFASGVAQAPTIESREGTPAPNLEVDPDQVVATDCLVVTFDKLLDSKIRNGLQLGTKPTSSHILLGHRGTPGISARQCSIVVDDELRIFLHDYKSTYGTAVGYNHKNTTSSRRNHSWILAYEPGSENVFGLITIHAASLAISVTFPNHVAGHPEYVGKLRELSEAWRGEAASTTERLAAVEELNLDSVATTQAPSRPLTPSTNPIYYRHKLIGSGSFGSVYTYIRAFDGRLLAAKIFAPQVKEKKRKRQSDPDGLTWLANIRREFTIMQKNPHPNIIRVFELRETPKPAIIMEYYPCGNISEMDLSESEYITAFGQILAGLEHLHGQSIAHRDLKPDNILVTKTPTLKVVIADFGMAKMVRETTMLHTFCGSPKYMAPEVFPGVADGHDTLADIWSLGIMGLEWVFILPRRPPDPRKQKPSPTSGMWLQWVEEWNKRVIDMLNDQDDDLFVSILSHMIRIPATERWSAQRCLEKGFSNGLFSLSKSEGLVTCTNEENPEDLLEVEEVEEVEDDAMTLRAPSNSQERSFNARYDEDERSTIRVAEPYTIGRVRAAVTMIDEYPIMADVFMGAAEQGYCSRTGTHVLPQDSSSSNENTGCAAECVDPAERALAWVNASHMSTREIFHRGDMVYLVIRQQAVEMNKDSCQLNACQIHKIAGRASHHNFKVLRANTIVQKGQGRDLWVPFDDGVFLAQKLGVEEELRPLFELSGRKLPSPENNYFYRSGFRTDTAPDGFAILWYNDHAIFYRPAEKQINATQVFKANGRNRSSLANFLKKNAAMARDVRNDHPRTQGTYIRLADAEVLCRHLGISFVELGIPVDLELNKEREQMHGANERMVRKATIQRQRSKSTASGSIQTPAGTLSGRNSPDDSKSIYTDCWLDPCHPLGRGSSTTAQSPA